MEVHKKIYKWVCFKKKMNNKKGAEESGGAIVIFLLVILVAAVIALSTYGFFSKVNTAVDSQKIATKSAIAQCSSGFKPLVGSPSDTDVFTKYCRSFSSILVEVGSLDSYVTCAYLEQQGATTFSLDDVSSTIKNACSLDVMKEAAYNKCVEYNNTNKGSDKNWKVYLNGVECSKSTAKDEVTLKAAFGITEETRFNSASGLYNINFDSLKK